MTLLDLTIKTIIKERLPFPELVYLNVKTTIVKYIIKYDRDDILRCVNYDMHYAAIIKMIPKMYHWNSIKCFSLLNLHMGRGIYLIVDDHFDHKRIIRGYLPTQPHLTLTKEEAYIILLRHNSSFVKQIIDKGIIVPFNWPLSISKANAEISFNPLAMKKVNQHHLCNYVNSCTSDETREFLIHNCRTVNKLLNLPALLIKLDADLITENQFVSCVNLRKLSTNMTLDNIKKISRKIDVFHIRWPKTVEFYKSEQFNYLLHLNEWVYTSKAFNKIVRYAQAGLLSPSYLEKCLMRGCSVTGLYTHLTIDMVDIYVKYGGKLLTALKRLNITPQQVNCKFEDDKDKLEAISYYCELGDLNTIEYIVKTS
tara:strand:- start:13 stop:1116 length:1104 start_codon:yes stop_codon:yes gene_type:complete